CATGTRDLPGDIESPTEFVPAIKLIVPTLPRGNADRDAQRLRAQLRDKNAFLIINLKHTPPSC
ncbi:MAG: hypothetical protein ACOH2R_26565, partial [Pseudomonas sp.]